MSSFLFYSYLSLNKERERIISEVSESARIVGRTIANEIERGSLHQVNKHRELDRIISYFSLDTLNEIRMYDQNKNVLYQQEMVAQDFSPEQNRFLDSVSENLSAEVVADIESKSLSIYVPIYLPEFEYSSSEKIDSGILYLNFDLSKKLEYAEDTEFRSFIISLFELLALGLILNFILKKLIFQRLRLLNAASLKIRNNDYDVSLDGKCKDEICQINQAFNEMTVSIKEAQEKLNHQIKQEQLINQSLVELKEAAETANQAKSQFLSSMSHELRTPLNAILGFSQLLQLDESSAKKQEQLGYITAGGKHLLSLVNQILELSKIESGDLNLKIESVSVQAVITESLELVRPLLTNYNVHVIDTDLTKLDYYVSADQTRLKQVLINFISNAIKYNKSGGSIKVHTELQTVNGQEKLKIMVEDTGYGIPLKLQPSVFEAFNRLGNEGGSIEGSGVGLSITKVLVEGMGGEVGFESVENQGSVFWAILPI